MASVVEETVEPVPNGVHAGGQASTAEQMLASVIDDRTLAASSAKARGAGVAGSKRSPATA